MSLMTAAYPPSAALPIDENADHLVAHSDLEALIMEQKNHLPLPQGVSEEVALDVGEHTPTKKI